MKIDGDDDIVVIVSSKRRRADGPVLRNGPLKGKRVELASTTGIDRLEKIADDFMLDIFDFEPGDCHADLLEIFRRLHEHQAGSSGDGLAQ